MTKKGIELSLNFLVTIIIALVIFTFGIRFIYNIASEANELESITTDELDKRIGQLLCESTEKVCIGTNKKVIQKGEFDVFGIRIINILDDDNDNKNFEINIEKPTPSGYTKNNVPISENIIQLKYRKTIAIEKNEEENIGVGVEVPKNAQSGTYIFNVEIRQSGESKLYEPIHKIYVEVP